MITRLWIDEEVWNGYYIDGDDGVDYLKLAKLNFFIGVNNSGKSRFVRQLVTQESNNLRLETLTHSKEKFSDEVEFLTDLKIYDKKFFERVDTYFEALLQKNFLTLDDWYNIQHGKVEFEEEIELYGKVNRVDSDCIIKYRNFCKSQNQKLFEKLNILTFPERFYIPVLRGLRPLDPNDDAYQTRTNRDYFEKVSISKVETGHNLYGLLVEYLLGIPEDRARVREYERKLGEVFFEGKEVVLIPEHGSDTIAMKIGDDPQFPIYDLGDGLQQVIIITSHAFLNNEEAIYCIEEPEVHMHPGLLRRLAIFLAEETPHQYLMTTHSNHLFDLADERDDVLIHKVTKQITDEDGEETRFSIKEASQDRDLLLELGVKPSSVYLANCTIWVEGVTDRFYIRAFLKRYLKHLQESEQTSLFEQYSFHNENYHYAFVEYQGGVLTHWIFDDDDPDNGKVNGLSALKMCSEILLIADGDIKSKSDREENLNKQLGDRLIVLDGKEIENYLPATIINKTARLLFETKTKNVDGADIDKIDTLETIDFHVDLTNGIGRVIDDCLGVSADRPVFSELSGTIKDKMKFCQKAVSVMDNTEWEMPDYLIDLCEKIFKHIQQCN